MKPISERLNKAFKQEMDTRSREAASRLQQLSNQFDRLERQGLVQRDRYAVANPTSISPFR